MLLTRLTSRPRRSLLAALVLVVIAGVLGAPVAGSLESSGGFLAADSGAERTAQRIEAATGRQASPGVLLLVDTPKGTAAARARLDALQRDLARDPDVAQVASPTSVLTRGRSVARATPGLVAQHGRSALVAATVRAGVDDDLVAERVLDRYAGVDDVTVGGQVIGGQQIGDRVGADLGRAETLALPLLILLSLLFFRRRAALLPLAVGVTTVLVTFVALRVVNEAYGLSVFALNLVIGLGLGLAIDYTLFLVTRFREELERAPEDVPGAVRRTMATAGRTVAFSSATVAAALITLVVFPLGFAKSMGIAGAVVAVVAAGASLALTPVLFSLWGSKLLVAARGGDGPGGWYRLSHAVMRRPALIAVATAAVMLVAASPALRAQFTPIDAAVIPKGDSARTVADRLAVGYPRLQTSPVVIAVDAGRGDGARVAAYADAVGRQAGVTSVSAPRPLDARTWELSATVTGGPQGERARSLVEQLRADTPGLLVGGAAAEFVDQQAAIRDALPLAAGLLALLTFGVLWVMTGSAILPLKAILMNVLTVGAALGGLVLVYQDGRFQDLLGYTANGGIESTDFLVTAALVFALSTDYGVFLLGRIKEARDGGAGEREAVALGLERTGRTVTAAAILLAVAIGAFATSSISFIQQIGVATATGVLLDAFVVRALLVPSLMALLGRWNWWTPRWSRGMHRRLGSLEGVHQPA